MDKLDLRKLYKALYAAKLEPALIEVPPLQYLMADGHGDPNDNPLFQQRAEALYGLAYTLKFALKKDGVADYGVMGLEGLWWADDPAELLADRRERWHWILMVLQPDFVTPEMVEGARAALAARKPVAGLEEVRLANLEEGLSAQVLHIGPYRDERPTIAMLHQFISDEGKKPHGRHHEIYLSDPRRTAPEKLKTILRQPVR